MSNSDSKIKAQMIAPSIRKKIGQMLMFGFQGISANVHTDVYQMIHEVQPGGLWFTDWEDKKLNQVGNIESPEQLRKLITDLQKISEIPLFTAIDAEGGQVIRLQESKGFPKTMAAKQLGKINNPETTFEHHCKIAMLLKTLGFSLNLAPVVDLDLSPDSPALGIKERCFSSDEMEVIRHSEQVILANKKFGVRTCLKHFPGHGSAQSDTHLDITDITTTYKSKELQPYSHHIENKNAEAILVAHVFHKEQDEQFPASLSKNIITGLLREKMNFGGVVISDDLNMGAIRKNYPFEKGLELAINAGADILLQSNLDPYDKYLPIKTLQTIENLVLKKVITSSRIEESFLRIQKLKEGI